MQGSTDETGLKESVLTWIEALAQAVARNRAIGDSGDDGGPRFFTRSRSSR